MLFSRYQIEDAQHHYFRSQSIDEFIFSKKGFIVANIDIGNGKRVRLVNTHLSAGGLLTHPESARAMALRASQIKELNHLAPDVDYLIGDLNCGPEVARENFQAFFAAGYFDLTTANEDDIESAFVTWDPQNPLNKISLHASSPPQRIDHILAKKQPNAGHIFSGATRILDKSFPLGDGAYTTPSDHYGILVTHGSSLMS
jgi:endonuclease/exonuclease/phosphatase family metal-dependent hydrolase